MAGAREIFVHEARLALEAGTDTAAPGAAVTSALCGHWDHEGPCRWPHNNDVDAGDAVTVFRTLFVAPPFDEDEVRTRIVGALQEGSGWAVLRTQPRPVSPLEEPLARRLAGHLPCDPASLDRVTGSRDTRPERDGDTGACYPPIAVVRGTPGMPMV